MGFDPKIGLPMRPHRCDWGEGAIGRVV